MNWTKATTPLTDALSQVVGYRESTGHYLTGKLYLREDGSVCVENEDALLCDVSHYAVIVPPTAEQPDYKALLRLAGELSTAVGLLMTRPLNELPHRLSAAGTAKAAYDAAIMEDVAKRIEYSPTWPGAYF